jgi:hypothetical protein
LGTQGIQRIPQGKSLYERAWYLHDHEVSTMKIRPTLPLSMERAYKKGQSRMEQWYTIIHERTSLIKPIISIIQQYHGRFGYGDFVQFNIPDGVSSLTRVPTVVEVITTPTPTTIPTTITIII